ncbi:hypothetical protein INR49_028585 [Caranx melampygus]|nr:hypothetical protein INR49_028585 [Caranx melampygus]
MAPLGLVWLDPAQPSLARQPKALFTAPGFSQDNKHFNDNFSSTHPNHPPKIISFTASFTLISDTDRSSLFHARWTTRWRGFHISLDLYMSERSLVMGTFPMVFLKNTSSMVDGLTERRAGRSRSSLPKRQG